MVIDDLEPIIEFHHEDPIPPGVFVYLKKFGITVKVYSNQRDIAGGFTIRGREVKEDHNNMNAEIKTMLTGLGLTKQEVEIILGAISGVKIAPFAYSSLNDMTAEITEAKAFKETVTEKLAGLAGLAVGSSPVAKKQRATRSDKGKKKTSDAPPIVVGGPGVIAPAATDGPKDDGKEDAPPPPPTRRDGKKGTKGKETVKVKESEQEIKDNVRALGGEAPATPPPGVDL